MTRYVAFLRGVSPMNARMPELKAAFEAAGFTDVKTVLASGNVVFGARAAATSALEKKCEQAMAAALDHPFPAIVRSAGALAELLATDPYAAGDVPAHAKRVVTFLRRPPEAKLALPLVLDGAQIVAVHGCEVFSAYTPGPKGPVFMSLIEKTFGRDVTTRTWDTVRKCVAAAAA